MKRVTIKSPITGQDSIKGWQVSDYFGVAKAFGAWQVFHLPTGLHMGTPDIASRAEATKRAQETERLTLERHPLLDWSKDTFEALNAQHGVDFTAVCRIARAVVYGQEVPA